MNVNTESRATRHTFEAVRSIQWWTPSMCSLRIDKPARYAFQAGHYARLGLPGSTTPEAIVWRPYSIVSAPAEPFLEFLITIVPGGELTSQLAQLKPGDTLALEPAACGFFLPAQLSPGEALWMFATGAGIGPYLSILREGRTPESFKQMVLIHSVRRAGELAYRDEILQFQAHFPARLQYVPVVTREPGTGALQSRIPQAITDHALQNHVGMSLDATYSRVMVCGNPDFTADMRRLLGERHFQPCRRNLVGSMLFENYW